MPKDLIGSGRLRVGINRQDTRDHIAIFIAETGETFVSAEKYSNTENAVLAVGRARGTPAAPAIVAAGDIIGEVEFFAYTNQWHHCAEIISTVLGTPAAGVVPDSDLQFFTTEAGGLNLRGRLMPNGQFILGAAAFLTEAEIAAQGIGRIWIGNTSDSNMFNVQLAGNNANSPACYFSKSRGTLPVPATVATNDEMMYLQGRAYTNAWHTNVGAIRLRVVGTVTAGQRPASEITLRTNPSGAGGPTDRLTVDPDGNIGINSTSYGTSSQGVIAIGNRAAAPTANPTGGGVLYAEAGALKWRGSGGTTTTIAPA